MANKVWLITGAGRGMGVDISKAALAAGHQVITTGRIQPYPIYSGFGIGLYLSAEIVHRHNGKIWSESQVEQGSTFYFSLPAVNDN